jgi:hypothetical protein
MKRQSKNIQRTRKHVNAPADLTGMRFGKWVVLKDAGIRVCLSGGRKSSRHMWLCRCDCGTQQEVDRANLTGGRSTQCRRCRSPRNRLYHPKLYVAWNNLKREGQFPEEWRDFDVFRKVVGDPPSKEAYLRQYDLRKPYSPENTVWATPAQLRQARKKVKDESVVSNPMLMKIRNAKSRDEMIRRMIVARKAGYTYEMLGIAAGVTRQRVHQILTAH